MFSKWTPERGIMLRKSIANRANKKTIKTKAKGKVKSKVKGKAKITQQVVSQTNTLDLLLKKKDGPINFRAVHDAWEYMQETGIEEFEYRSDKIELKLRASNGFTAPAPRLPMVETRALPVAPVVVAPVAAPQKSANVHVITCPFVGTFYRSPGPNENAFVDVGSMVRPSDVLCIVEAMKLMNEIESDASGRISKVLVENGTAVEFGEPLFEIEKI